MGRKKNSGSEDDEKAGRVNVLHTLPADLKDWLDAEKKKTGRSVSFMIELAVTQWRDRIVKRRKDDE